MNSQKLHIWIKPNPLFCFKYSKKLFLNNFTSVVMGNKSRLPLKTNLLQLQSQAPLGRFSTSETSEEALRIQSSPGPSTRLPRLSVPTHSSQNLRFGENNEPQEEKRRREGNNGATELESVSGYHSGSKRKQVEPRNWQLQLLFVLFLKGKFHKIHFWGSKQKCFLCYRGST